MLIDTHCHLNMMVKKEFDVALQSSEIVAAAPIIEQAAQQDVQIIINVGTSVVESLNCVQLAQHYDSCYAVIGIHPNDCTPAWQDDLKQLKELLRNKEQHKIVGIGECGLDFHYPDYNFERQRDAFRAQIELALEHDLGLVVHSRDARDETLRVLEEYAGQMQRGIIHCFSEDTAFAQQVIAWGYALGIGGTISYPKNNELRAIVSTVPLKEIVLETDAPFLPPQPMRGKQNNPSNIAYVAQFITELREESLQKVADTTTERARSIFGIE